MFKKSEENFPSDNESKSWWKELQKDTVQREKEKDDQKHEKRIKYVHYKNLERALKEELEKNNISQHTTMNDVLEFLKKEIQENEEDGRE